MVVSDNGEQMTVDRSEILKFDYKDDTLSAAKNDAIPFGTMVLADGKEDVDERIFYAAQVIGRHKDGRNKVYYLNDGSFGYVEAHQVTPMSGAGGSFKSPSDAKMFSSCDEFYKLVMPGTDGKVFQREIGDGCLMAVTWPMEGSETTTLVATYDGQIHMDYNAYSSVDIFEKRTKASLITMLTDREIDGTDKKQTDFHPRGYGRVINFRHELKQTNFGTKYPRSIL